MVTTDGERNVTVNQARINVFREHVEKDASDIMSKAVADLMRRALTTLALDQPAKDICQVLLRFTQAHMQQRRSDAGPDDGDDGNGDDEPRGGDNASPNVGEDGGGSSTATDTALYSRLVQLLGSMVRLDRRRGEWFEGAGGVGAQSQVPPLEEVSPNTGRTRCSSLTPCCAVRQAALRMAAMPLVVLLWPTSAAPTPNGSAATPNASAPSD